MAVVFDTTFIMPTLRPEVGFPADSDTKQPIPKARERLEFLLQGLEKSGTRIIVPTPALAEILVRADFAAAQRIVETLDTSRIFKIEPFDTLAAIELSAMTRAALAGGDKKAGIDAPWAKLKYDRQIVAIAKVHNATAVYSDDRDIFRLGEILGLPVIRFKDLEAPPEDPQIAIEFEAPQTAEGPEDEIAEDPDEGIKDEAPESEG